MSGGYVSLIALGIASAVVRGGISESRAANAASAETDHARLEEVLVTAQRREQRLQDVPIAINSVSGDRLDAVGIKNIFALQAASPGLNVVRVANTSTPFLRGVGSNAANAHNEASVATYVDGIYYAAPFGNTSYNNIDRIEVLKGPQGTLFGRNATGGVIQVVTRDPSYDPSMSVNVGHANYDTYSADGYGTAGLTENIGVDLAVQYRNQRDGWGRDFTRNEDVKYGREFIARSKLLYTPSDKTKVVLMADYGEMRDTFADFVLPEGVVGISGTVPYTDYHNTNNNDAPLARIEASGLAMRIEHDFPVAKFVSLTARRDSKAPYYWDNDATPLDFFRAELHATVRRSRPGHRNSS